MTRTRRPSRTGFFNDEERRAARQADEAERKASQAAEQDRLDQEQWQAEQTIADEPERGEDEFEEEYTLRLQSAHKSRTRRLSDPVEDEPEEEPDTDGVGHNRLRVIAFEIRDNHRQYKDHAQQSAMYMLNMGKLLIEVEEKILKEYGKFCKWIDENCPFKQRTAFYYMAAVRCGATTATIAEVGLVAASKKLMGIKKPGVPKRAQKRAAHHENEETPEQRKARRAEESEEAKQQGKIDPYRKWLEPKDDGEVAFAQWKAPGDIEQIAYWWNHKDAHSMAESRAHFVRRRLLSGPTARRINWIFVRNGFDDEGNHFQYCATNEFEDGEVDEESKDTMESLRAKLRMWSDTYGYPEIETEYYLPRNPAIVELVSDWQREINYARYVESGRKTEEQRAAATPEASDEAEQPENDGGAS